MRTDNGHLFTVCYSKGVSHHQLHFDRDSEADGRVGKVYSVPSLKLSVG